HALRLGSSIGPFDAAQTRRRARGTEAYSRADAGRDVARAAEEARRERGACRTLSRKPTHGAEDRRRSLPALAGAAEDAGRPARSGAPRAQAISAARRGRRSPAAAVRRGPSDPAGRRTAQPRRPASGVRTGG